MSKSIKLKNDTYIDLSALLHPVGEIYTTTNSSFNPNNEWCGTWERLEDKFLVGAGNLYQVNSTGGEATHTLTVNEMPSHNHPMGVKTGSGSSSQRAVSGTTSNWGAMTFDDSSGYLVQARGGSQAHNNMPPYIAVFMWHRVS